MTQHYTRNTKQVSAWCPTCRRTTMHRVDDRRLGSCLEHNAEGMTKKQQAAKAKLEAERQQPAIEGLL